MLRERSCLGFNLSVDRLAASWDGSDLFSDVSFELAAGETLAIVGESGCGKSTLLSTLAGFKTPSGGSVSWRSNESTGETRLPRKAMVWQNLALFPWKRVRENLALPLQLTHAQNIEERVSKMLAEFELTGLDDRFPSELSGGQRQRLALGRALIAEPDILFMDEPFSALDALLRERLQDFLKGLWLKRRCSIIFVTHDIGEAVFLGSHILMMAARPSRMVVCAANSAFDPSNAYNVRESDAFFNVSRHLHSALIQARDGAEIHVPAEATW